MRSPELTSPKPRGRPAATVMPMSSAVHRSRRWSRVAVARHLRTGQAAAAIPTRKTLMPPAPTTWCAKWGCMPASPSAAASRRCSSGDLREVQTRAGQRQRPVPGRRPLSVSPLGYSSRGARRSRRVPEARAAARGDRCLKGSLQGTSFERGINPRFGDAAEQTARRGAVARLTKRHADRHGAGVGSHGRDEPTPATARGSTVRWTTQRSAHRYCSAPSGGGVPVPYRPHCRSPPVPGFTVLSRKDFRIGAPLGIRGAPDRAAIVHACAVRPAAKEERHGRRPFR
jgi:hypothetical protein